MLLGWRGERFQACDFSPGPGLEKSLSKREGP